MKTPAKLQRLITKPGALPKVEHLHRNEALFAALEWEWKSTPEGAHVFPDLDDATAAQEAHGGFPVICGTPERPADPEPAPAAQAPAPAPRLARTIAERVATNRAGRKRRNRTNRDPRAVFAELERRSLA